MNATTLEFWPAWLRWGVIAFAMMMLCACQRNVMPSLDQSQVIQNEFPQPTQAKEVVGVSGQSISTTEANANVFHADVVGNSALESDSQSVESTDDQTKIIVTAKDSLLEHSIDDTESIASDDAEGVSKASCSTGEACATNKKPCFCLPCQVPEIARDEYLCDGGDAFVQAGMIKDGTIVGLEPTETVGTYDTRDGRTVIAPSNRVCIYAPRFGAVRKITGPILHQQKKGVEGLNANLGIVKLDERQSVGEALQEVDLLTNRATAPPSALRSRQLGSDVKLLDGIVFLDGALKAFENLDVLRTGKLQNTDAVLLAEKTIAAVSWSHDLGVQITIEGKRAQVAVGKIAPTFVYHVDEPNKPRLRIIKLASKKSAQPGDFVEFTIRYDNIGDQEMGNVTIEDNLTARLEYVLESAKSDRKAEFTALGNKVGSDRLRWDIVKPLKAGEGGIVTFKCKVR